MTSTTNAELEGVGKAGAIAEECLMGVRTVQAFNGQETMVDRYRNPFKIIGNTVDMKQSYKRGRSSPFGRVSGVDSSVECSISSCSPSWELAPSMGAIC